VRREDLLDGPSCGTKEPNFVEEKENGANSCHFAKANCLLGEQKVCRVFCRRLKRVIYGLILLRFYMLLRQ
jgi:hypothetical protein